MCVMQLQVMFSKPLPALSCRLNAWVTMLTCQWLMGPCKVLRSLLCDLSSNMVFDHLPSTRFVLSDGLNAKRVSSLVSQATSSLAWFASREVRSDCVRVM